MFIFRNGGRIGRERRGVKVLQPPAIRRKPSFASCSTVHGHHINGLFTADMSGKLAVARICPKSALIRWMVGILVYQIS